MRYESAGVRFVGVAVIADQVAGDVVVDLLPREKYARGIVQAIIKGRTGKLQFLAVLVALFVAGQLKITVAGGQ